MRSLRKLCTLAAGLTLSLACAGAQGNAERAVASADSALAAVGAEVGRVSPEQLDSLSAQVLDARADLANGEYEAAVGRVAGVPARADALLGEVPARTAELTEIWNTLAVAMPRNLSDVEDRLERIARTGRLPAGATQAAVDEARAIHGAAPAEWAQAMAAWEAGELARGVRLAEELKVRVSQAMVTVGLVADDRAWGNARPITP